VEISGNQVDSPRAYMDADGIHVGGRVHDFLITHNSVTNRGDAGIAASSEAPSYVCAGGVIEDNALVEDQVGLDNSGCTHTLWRENFVRAEAAPWGSNPAFRSITYLGMRSSFVTAIGNYLENAPGKQEFAAKVDEDARPGEQNIVLRGNTIRGLLSLYLRGAGISVEGNVFAGESSTVTIDYDGPKGIATDSVFLGTNRWLGLGVVRSGDNPALLTHLKVAEQSFSNSGNYIGMARSAVASSGIEKNRVLQIANPSANDSGVRSGSCSSLKVDVPEARTSMSVVGTNERPVPNRGAVSWAFVSREGVVTVRSCVVTSSVLSWPRSLAIG
jgi:hypothetical protein